MMDPSPIPTTTFILDKQFLRRSKQLTQFLVLAIPLFVALLFVLTPLYFSPITSPCLGFLLVVGLIGLGVTTIWGHPNVKKRLASQRVVLTDRTLQLRRQGFVQTIAYAEIQQVTLFEKKTEQIQSILIRSGDDACTLGGFDGMAQITQQLLANLPDSARVQRQPAWLDRSTLTYAMGSILLVVLGMVWFIQVTEGAITDFMPWYFLISGAFVLWRRPYSRRDGKQKRSEELLMGWVYLLLGGLTLIGELVVNGGAAAVWRNPCHLIGRVVHQSGCINTVASEDVLYFAADNRTILWPDDRWNNNRQVYVTGYASWLGVWTPTWRYDELNQLVVSKDGRTAVVIAEDRTVVDVWDIASRTRRQHLTLETYGSYLVGEGVQLSPDGHYLADVGITIWDLTTGQKVREIPSDAAALAFSPDGQYLAGATATSNEITIWRISDGTVSQRLDSPQAEGRSKKQLHFSPDGQWLLVGDELPSETAIEMALWNLSMGERRYVWPIDWADAQYQVTFSPNNQFVVGAVIEAYWDEERMRWPDSDETQLYVWRLADGALVKKQFLGVGSDYQPVSLDFAPDGSRLAVGLNDVGMIFQTERLFAELLIEE